MKFGLFERFDGAEGHALEVSFEHDCCGILLVEVKTGISQMAAST